VIPRAAWRKMPGQYRAQLIVCLNLIAIMPCRSAAQQPTSGPPQQRPPNIVLIFPDNLGWGEWARTAALGAIPWPDSVGFSPRNETIDAARRSSHLFIHSRPNSAEGSRTLPPATSDQKRRTATGHPGTSHTYIRRRISWA
jgi:hypothetical protein